jgi:hypothetical protein
MFDSSAKPTAASDQYISKLLDESNAAILDAIKKGRSNIRKSPFGTDCGLSKEDRKEDKQHTSASCTSPADDQCRAALSDPRPHHPPFRFQECSLTMELSSEWYNNAQSYPI